MRSHESRTHRVLVSGFDSLQSGLSTAALVGARSSPTVDEGNLAPPQNA